MPDTTTEIQEGPLVLQQIQESGRVRLALHGELDLTNTATLEVVLNAALASGDDVLVDLAKLEFLDSTGISLLVAALKGRDAKRIGFLPSESTAVTRLLSLTGLDKRLDFDGSGRHASRPAA